MPAPRLERENTAGPWMPVATVDSTAIALAILLDNGGERSFLERAATVVEKPLVDPKKTLMRAS